MVFLNVFPEKLSVRGRGAAKSTAKHLITRVMSAYVKALLNAVIEQQCLSGDCYQQQSEHCTNTGRQSRAVVLTNPKQPNSGSGDEPSLARSPSSVKQQS